MKENTQPEIIGHRGAHDLAPDNTVAGFKLAIEYGAQIETDLQLTADGVIILVHDPKLVGDDGVKRDIASTVYEDLKMHKADLLTLDEAVRYVNRRTRMMLEIKDHRATPAAIGAIKRYLSEGWQLSDFSICSFKFPPLAACKAALPDIELIVLDNWSGVRATHRARKLHTPYLSMNQSYLWPGFIRGVSRHYKLFCYPSDSSLRPFRHRQPDGWDKYGLYGIITNRPDKFAAKKVIIGSDEGKLSKSPAADRDDQHILV